MKELEDKQTGIEYFETFIRYILNAGQNFKKSDVEEIVNKIGMNYPDGSEVVMSLAEILREEGEIKGRQEGEIKGIEKGIEKTTIRLLTKKFGIISEEIKAKISKLDTITLETIIDGIFEYKDLDDIKKYLE